MVMFLVAALIGIVVGILSGLLGIGGGTLMVPVFRLLLGLNPLMATGTSLFTIIPTSLAGLAKHIQGHTAVPKLGLLCGIAGACLSPLGVMLANISPGWLIMLVVATIIGYSSITMFRKGITRLRQDRAAEQASATAAGTSTASSSVRDAGVVGTSGGAAVAVRQTVSATGAKPLSATASTAASAAAVADDEVDLTFDMPTVLRGLLIGCIAGLCGGYAGVGGGFIMVPMFISLLGIPMRKASGTSLIAVCLLAVPGVITQGMLGNIDYAIGIAMAVGSIPGSVLGASLVKKVPEAQLRLGFAVFLLLMAVLLVVNEVA
jgi:uncharacterized membrane protein YfcA